MMLKRNGLAGVLAVVMLCGLSACNNNEERKAKDFSISIYGGELNTVSQEAPVKRALEERLGIELSYIDSTWDTRHSKLNVMISSGKTPDLFTSGYIQGDKLDRLIRQDVIAELSPYIEQYPNIKRRMEEFQTVSRYGEEKCWFIPVKSTDTEVNVVCEHAWFYRKDIVEQIGLPLPANVEEFYQFLKDIKAYQQKNGQNDASPMTLEDGYFLYCIYDLFGTSLSGVENVDGTLQPKATGNKMKQAVLFARQLYEEGLLDKEFMLTPNWNFMFDKFLKGDSPVIYTNYKYDKMTDICRLVYPQKDPKDMIAYIPVMVNTDGEKKVKGQYNYFGGLYFKKEQDETKLLKKLELVDYMLSEEGMRLLRYGVEGEHYRMENGVPVSTLGTDYTGAPKKILDVDSSAGIKSLVMYDVLFMDGQSPYREYITEIRDEYLRYANVENAFLYQVPSVQIEMDYVALEEFAQNSIVKLVAETENFDAAWEQYCRAYMEKGGAKLAEYAALAQQN